MKIIIAVFLFILSFFLIGQNLNKPFWGVHDWNGVRYGNIAKNYLKYGLLETKLGQVENSGSATKEEFKYYTHYPPLLPLSIGLSYKIFGIYEWSTRIIPLLATTGSIVLIFFTGLKLYNLKVGLVAALVALATPMSQYFGKNASHEPLTLFFVLLSFYGYLVYQNKFKYSLILFTAGLVLAEMTAWAGYFLVPAITVVAFLRKDFKELKFIIPFWFISFLMFFIHIGIVYVATGTLVGGSLVESLLQRSGILSGVQPEGFNFLGYIDRLRLWFSTTFTLTLTLLSSIWVIHRIIDKNSDSDWYILILGFFGLIYVVVFSNAVYIHNYLIFYFLPFLSISGALLLFSLKNKYDRLVHHTELKKIYFIFVVVAIIVITFERRAFLIALNNSKQDKLAVEIGKVINKESGFDDIVLISPSSFANSADNFLKFYSDRQLKYSDSDLMEYDLKVIVDQNNQKFEIIKK